MPLRLPHLEFRDGTTASASFRFNNYTPASIAGDHLRDLKTGRCRHPASRDTRTTLYIGRSRHGPGQSLDQFLFSPSPCLTRHLHIPVHRNTVSTPPSAQAALSVSGQLKPAIKNLARHLRSLTATG